MDAKKEFKKYWNDLKCSGLDETTIYGFVFRAWHAGHETATKENSQHGKCQHWDGDRDCFVGLVSHRCKHPDRIKWLNQ